LGDGCAAYFARVGLGIKEFGTARPGSGPAAAGSDEVCSVPGLKRSTEATKRTLSPRAVAIPALGWRLRVEARADLSLRKHD